MQFPYAENYLFHGIPIRIGSTRLDDFESLKQVLSGFPKTGLPPNWEFYSSHKPIYSISRDLGKPILKNDMYQFWQARTILWTQYHELAIISYIQDKHACYVSPLSEGVLWDSTTFIHHIFYVALIQKTAELKWFSVHGAGVSFNGVGILIVAPSGGGKSTLSISLGLAGFSVLSDDRVILRLREEQSEIMSMLEPIRVRCDSLSLLPKTLSPIKREKNSVCKILLIPKITNEPKPSLIPISKIEGMQAILNQSTIRLLPRKLVEGQFSRLIDWLKDIQCYRLNMTSDLYRVNELVLNLI